MHIHNDFATPKQKRKVTSNPYIKIAQYSIGQS